MQSLFFTSACPQQVTNNQSRIPLGTFQHVTEPESQKIEHLDEFFQTLDKKEISNLINLKYITKT